MKLLVIGGTGFFGKSILRYLSSLEGLDRPDVTFLSRDPQRFIDNHPEFLEYQWVKYIQADITKNLTQIKHQNYSHIIHAAADSTNVTELSDLFRFDQIVGGTRNVLDYVVEKQKAAKLLFISSGGVYGELPEHLESASEDLFTIPNPQMPTSFYSIAKRTAEHLCFLYHQEHGLNLSIARCFSFSGIDLPLDVHFAIGNFVKNARDGEDIIIKGDGSPIRSYLDQEDLAEWLMAILKKDLFEGDVYNLGSEIPISIADLASKVKEISNKSINVQIQEKISEPALQGWQSHNKNIYVPDIKTIKERFNVREKVSINQSIRSMLEKNKIISQRS